MKKRFYYFIVLALLGISASAKIQLPEIISDNMVLQQNTHVKLWGKAKINTTIHIKASWSNQNFTTKSDKDGRWSIQIPTPDASYDAQNIRLSDGETTTLNNILIGEVWFCSGQSNMEMPLNGFRNCPIEGGNEAIATAGQWKGIRFATIDHVEAITPQETCPGKWKISIPENAHRFSATAFYFATMLNKVLDVPVGIINCSWGGSTVEGWLPEDILKSYPDIDLEMAKQKKGQQWSRPMIMYNGMIKPLQNYTVKGFLWYQGEANVNRYQTYAERLATMVELWRKEWGLGNLPFYYVEIAPYRYNGDNSSAYLREAQYKAQALIPNSGMISTNDLVEPYEIKNIHPKNKTSVGKRLCYMALANTYGIKGIECRGPEYKSMEIKDNKAILSFNNANEGYNRRDNMEGFEMAGADKVFHPAKAEMFDNQKIRVSCDEVKEPVAVRYCYRNFQIGNVTNHRELPIVPFRTDNWEE